MERPKAFVTRVIPEAGIERLASAYDVDVNRADRPLSPTEIAERAKGCMALVTLLTDRVDGALLDICPDVRVVANVAVGYDNVDVPAATERGVWVTNTPGVLTETTADLAWTLLMATARRIGEAERYVRAGKYHGWGILMLLGGDVYGKTLGVAGFGRIGQAVARRARGFDMRILYTDAQRAPGEVEEACNAAFVDKEALLRESDFLSLHMPLLAQTRHWLGERELRSMKRTAYVVNTSRGPVIDEASLARALHEGWIAGAGLDVFEEEPKIHPDLLTCENAVLVPHIGSASVETRDRMATIAAENCIAIARGERPPTAVNDPRAGTRA
ncbi:MAG TPA: D-glycerate dehydrogenase [Candidatus Dormibacteraeota bacterium]|nr:D-glycerate dehydrogenase [Candidatus Dormibacteraeota bacterium]